VPERDAFEIRFADFPGRRAGIGADEARRVLANA
jgi:hypothetical protein